MASMNTRLNIEKLDGNIVQNHGGRTQGNREAEVFRKRNIRPGGRSRRNGLVDETNMTLFAKVKCIFLGYHESIVGNKLWRLDDVTLKVVLYRNMGFNESGEYKKTFIGSDVGTGSVKVLQGVEFEEVQTQDLIYYHFIRNREQHSAWELFSYREDSNEADFAVTIVDKIYAHESLTFNNTVACEVLQQKVGTDFEGHSILSLEGSLSWDCVVEKNESGYELRLLAGIATSALVKGSSQSEVPAQVGSIRTTLTGFPAQSVRSSNTYALDSLYLLVLNTGMSQSRQHDMSELDSYYLSD
ncbi:hypothetical protein Tco_1191653 [Tanacetum coccineum]